MSSFTTPLELEYVDGRNWKITSEFDYHLGEESSIYYIKVPSGFLTDFASTPRLLWFVLPPTGKYGKAAVVHDFLYRIGVEGPFGYRYGRPECDGIFRDAMMVLGVGWLRRWIIWMGVRVGGHRSYRVPPLKL